MNARTRKALLESIEKWRQIEIGEMADMHWENCSLCLSTLNNIREVRCHLCPVFDRTKRRACNGTPYQRWFMETISQNIPIVADTPS